MMRVGFDISDLCLERAGVYTYGLQLVRHLAELADPPALSLIDGALRPHVHRPLAVDSGASPTVSYTQVRGLVRSMKGPWRKPFVGRLASGADECILLPFWRQIDSTPLGPSVARWRLPRAVTGTLDICHWSDSTFLRLSRAAHVVTIHDTIPLVDNEWHRRTAVAHHTHKLQRAARYATRLIAVSENTRRDVIDLLGVAPARIDVVPEAAAPEFHPPADADRDTYLLTLAHYGLHEGDYIICVGTIEPRKNLVRLAAGFKAAVERRPEFTTKLVLAGGKGWKTGPIERGLAEVGLGERLVLPGRVPQEDLPALLHGARAAAYVSLYEGFGLPPLEAMACGTPVVASNNSSIPEVVGDAGLLVDPYDVEAIAAALGQVLTDDGLRAELAARGLRRAARFSWARTAELTMQTYRRALADHRLNGVPRESGSARQALREM